MKCIFATLLIANMVSLSSGEDISWIGPDNGLWSAPQNWDLNRLPNSSDQVLISTDTALKIQVNEPPEYESLFVLSGSVTIACSESTPLIYNSSCTPTNETIKSIYIAQDNSTASLEILCNTFIEYSPDSCDFLAVRIYIGHGTDSTGSLFVPPTSPGKSTGDALVYVGYGENSTGLVHDSGYLFEKVFSNSPSYTTLSNGHMTGFVLCNDIQSMTSICCEGVTATDDLYADTITLQDNADIYSEDIYADLIDAGMNSRIGGSATHMSANILADTPPIELIFENFIDGSLTINIDSSSSPLVEGSYTASASYQISTNIYSQSGTTPAHPSLIQLANLSSSSSNGDSGLMLNDSPMDGKTYSIVRNDGISTLRIAPPNWNPADLDFDGDLDFFDISAFINYYQTQSPWANVDESNGINFFDVSAFLSHFNAP